MRVLVPVDDIICSFGGTIRTHMLLVLSKLDWYRNMNLTTLSVVFRVYLNRLMKNKMMVIGGFPERLGNDRH